jgi:cobalt-zinc-cadmium resistance protein CzcA
VIESLGTKHAGELQSGERRFPITIKIADRYRASPEAIGRILVTSADGDRIPLARLATIETVETPRC